MHVDFVAGVVEYEGEAHRRRHEAKDLGRLEACLTRLAIVVVAGREGVVLHVVDLQVLGSQATHDVASGRKLFARIGLIFRVPRAHELATESIDHLVAHVALGGGVRGDVLIAHGFLLTVG